MSDHATNITSSTGVVSGTKETTQIYANGPKRVFDILLSVLMLPFLLPVIGIVYLLVVRDGGPGFFGHTRIGRDGRKFKCWKLRTMVTDAQERLDELLKNDPAARAEWEKDRKLTNDPRITRFGNFLRRSSLDELPQLLNVLKGEMSLVGPRPVTEDELDMYGVKKKAYLAMRPGVTGLWQVSGRNDISYAERVALDCKYHDTVSFASDCRILAKTADAVLGKTGR